MLTHALAVASVEHYWPSTLLSLRPDLTFIANGTLMSCTLLLSNFICLIADAFRCTVFGHPGTQGVGHDGTTSSLDYVHNTFLTMAEAGLIRTAFEGGVLFARKFRIANGDVLDFIDGLVQHAAGERRRHHVRKRRHMAAINTA